MIWVQFFEVGIPRRDTTKEHPLKNKQSWRVWVVLCVAAVGWTGSAVALDPSGTPSSAAQGVETEVRAVYVEYHDSAKRKDGEAALALLHENTVKRFEDYLLLARTATREELMAQPVSTQIMVRMIRARVSHVFLWGCDGRGLLRYALSAGMLGQDSSIDRVEIEADRATIHLKGGIIHAHQEGGQWRLDLSSVLDNTAQDFDALAKQENMSLEALVDFLVFKTSQELMSGEQSWQPIEKIDVKIKHKADLPFDLKAPEIAPPRLVLSEHPTHGYRALLHPEISDDHTEMPEHKNADRYALC
jgi:hypothetical protein